MEFRGAKPPFMQKQKLIRFAQSLVLLPVMTISMPQGIIPKDGVNVVLTPQTVLSQKENIGAKGLLAFNQEVDQKAQALKAKADAIDAYFKAHDMPLEGTGTIMAQAADENDIDYRLIPAIATIESSGGKNACRNVKHSFLGWGSCKISFESDKEAIETVAKHLGGNVESTAEHYDGKTTKEILEAYNPPYIVPNYAKKVMSVMNEIGDAKLGNQTEA